MGGVSRVVLDATTFTRRSSNMVLLGTVRNCAGGPSPWGWITCEESFDKDHGYSFVCPIDADRARMPQRIVGYGRYYHEAAAIDPRTNVAYLTEDRDDGCVYRFVPTVKDKPFEGKLQALKIVGKDRFETSTQMMVGQTLDLEWVDVPNPDPLTDIIRGDAQRLGAALLRRGEGIWFAGGFVYICSTSGGPVSGGQIFRLEPAAGADGKLTLLAQSTDRTRLDMPDNIAMSPWGDLLMSEDGPGEQFVRALTPAGEVYDLARNAKSTSELSGVCCSPDGRALFVNLQKDGLTLVISGPFPGTTMEPAPDLGGRPDLSAAPDLATAEEPPGSQPSGCSAVPGKGGSGAGAIGAAAIALGATALVRATAKA
jgi:secreted PhoX family phosphatase